MAEPGGDTSQLQGLLDLARAGDGQAQHQLIFHACRRLEALTRRMLRCFPQVHRWEQTDDVLQNALIRLDRALGQVKPQTTRHFFNLAAIQIRRELLDLAKHYMRPDGQGAKHHTDGIPADDPGGSIAQQAVREPADSEEWTAFHKAVEKLPEDEGETFNLLFYEGLTQEEAATLLEVTVRTIKRRWQRARVLLHESLSAGR